MNDKHRCEFIERVADALAAHGIKVELDSTLVSDIVAAIETDHVIVSNEEFGDIRLMAERVEFLMGIVTEWGWLR